MSSPDDEAGRIVGNEKQHWRQIGRRYALGTRLVTVAQFQRFLKAHPEVKHKYNQQYSPEADCPMIHVTPLISLRENAIAKEPGSSYLEPWRCVSRLGASMVA
jgi:formylglycine-generating enzyme required for sulfatase activity